MMKTISGIAAVAVAAIAFLAVQAPTAQTATQSLRVAQEFRDIENPAERSKALFGEMTKVITHPRCMNCHPRDDSPRQGMAMQMHNPPVIRHDESGFGAPGMRCTTCHGAENMRLVGVGGIKSIPGHDVWHLAPKSMGWIGLSPAEICTQLKDPARNGGRSLADIHEHMAEDGLVGWAWAPGEGREPAPGTQARFGKLVAAWIDTGAHCPTPPAAEAGGVSTGD